MRRHLLMLLFSIYGIVALASNYELIVSLNNGTTETYLLSDNPLILFEANNMVVKTESVETSYQVEDVLKYIVINNTSNGVDKVVSASDFSFSIDNKIVHIYGATFAGIYSIDGRMIVSNRSETKDIHLDMTSCGNGIYVINTNVKKSIKVILQ